MKKLVLLLCLLLLTACASHTTPAPEEVVPPTCAEVPAENEPSDADADEPVVHDGLAALYLQVLEDLWVVDGGLNESGVEYIGVDLAATSLSPAEQAAVAHAFAQRHDAQAVTGTMEQLTEQGYITATPLTSSGSGKPLSGEKTHYFYEWENGCFFSITEQPMEGTYSLNCVTFDAHKWRSSLGAYWFSDCTSVQSALGEWSDYVIGSEMIA